MSLLKAGRPQKISARQQRLMNLVKEVSEGETMRLNANIPKRMYLDLKKIAAAENKKITEIILDCVDRYIRLAKNKDDLPTSNDDK